MYNPLFIIVVVVIRVVPHSLNRDSLMLMTERRSFSLTKSFARQGVNSGGIPFLWSISQYVCLSLKFCYVFTMRYVNIACCWMLDLWVISYGLGVS